MLHPEITGYNGQVTNHRIQSKIEDRPPPRSHNRLSPQLTHLMYPSSDHRSVRAERYGRDWCSRGQAPIDIATSCVSIGNILPFRGLAADRNGSFPAASTGGVRNSFLHASVRYRDDSPFIFSKWETICRFCRLVVVGPLHCGRVHLTTKSSECLRCCSRQGEPSEISEGGPHRFVLSCQA